MTPDESALLAAILANPGDDLPRLVMADWLDEHASSPGVCPRCEGRGEVRFCDAAGATDYEPCRTCGGSLAGGYKRGSGLAGNSNADRAEFIRVQCELAQRDRLAMEGNPDSDIGRYMLLRERERELWEQTVPRGWAVGFEPVQSLFSPYCHVCLPTDGIAQLDVRPHYPVVIVRRGFVAEVRCTLATLFGGPCPGCIEPGELDDGDSRCRLCKGSGHTPGIAGDLFRRQPVENVSLTDLTIWPSGGNDTYYLGGVSIFPAKYWRRLEGLPSRLAVKSEAESVCVEWGRELAGLPAINQDQRVKS